jgi:hypothetical protein
MHLFTTTSLRLAYHNLWLTMAEPLELYGPHVPVIILQTSDCYT